MRLSAKAVLGVLTVVLACGLHAAAAEHPVPLEKDADCAQCHEDKTKGTAVHSAIQMGCTACHEVKTEKDVTTVELNAPKNQLCFSCHERSKDKVQHGPYALGRCVTCHDPHTSNFPNQLRASTNELCLNCHGLDRPDVKWNPQDKTITLGWGQTLTLEQYQAVPKIGTDRKNTGHPMMGHPFMGVRDPSVKSTEKGKATEMGCLSCHQPHTSDTVKLMPKDVKSPMEVCGKCHE